MAFVFAVFISAFIPQLPVVGTTLGLFTIASVLPGNQGVVASAFVTLNNLNEREVFANSVAALQRAFSDTPGFDARNYKLTQSFLRVEQAIVAGITQYRFPVLVTETNPSLFNTEKRLNLQDSFMVSSVFIGLGAPGSATATNWIPLTYPDPTVFTTTTAADALTLYSGSFEIKVNNDVLVPDWDIWRHYYAPNRQAAAAIADVSPAYVNEQSGLDGWFPMEPNIVFVGAKNTKLTINLPSGITTALANSRIVLAVRGILAQNTTVVS